MTRLQLLLVLLGLVIVVSLLAFAYFIRHAEDDPDDRMEDSWRRRR
jgi:hypothetical protein